MSSEVRRSPKSSLAAAKSSATPWGLTTPKPSGWGRNERAPASVASASTVPARATAARGPQTSQSPRARPNAPVARRIATVQARSAGERRFTAALLACAVGLTLALAAVGARVTVVSSGSQERMDGTLGRASLQQMEFRAANQRFALWGELAARGATMPAQLEVVATNASSSHWFLKVRDRTTGITCSRIGQLVDAPGLAVVPDCEQPSP